MSNYYNRQWRLPNAWNGTESNVNKQSNYSMSFDGSEYINFGNPTELQFTDSFSISGWFKSSSSSSSAIVSKDANLSGRCYLVQLNSLSVGALRFRIFVSNVSVTIDHGTGLNDNNWHHFVCVYEKGVGISLYIDNGTPGFTATTGTIDNDAVDFNIGRRSDGLNYFNGQIDAVAVYNYALSASQVTTLYGSSSTGIGNLMSLSPKPVFYAPLGDQDAFNGANYLVPNSSLKDYVFSFDGSNDYITIPDSTTLEPQNLTVSAWVNWKTGSSPYSYPISKYYNTTESSYAITRADQPRFYITTSGGVIFSPIATSVNLIDTGWHHLVGTYDGSYIRFYVNGEEIGSGISATGSILYNSGDLIIGAFNGSGIYAPNGEQSNIQIWDSALSSSQVATLYNYGSPIKTLANIPQNSNLQGWWKLDASATYDSSTTTWTIPDDSSNSNDGTSSGMTQVNLVQSDLSFTSGYSPYALDFDSASSDYISIDTNGSFPFGLMNTGVSSTVSLWAKLDTLSQSSNVVLFEQTNGSARYVIWFDNNANTINFYPNAMKQSQAVNANQWYHIVATLDGTNARFYVGGSMVGTASTYTPTNTNQELEIGRSPALASQYFNGKISNVSIWNAALTSAQVTELYNEGVPSNLNNHSAYSNLVSWWQLGSNSSFNTNWTVLDEKGSNNGTSSNMGEDSIVDGVGSYANGLSSGMGGDEVIGDAPYSTANSLSVNMDLEDRIEDTPS